MAHIYHEITPDKGQRQICSARDNFAIYILTSARMHDLHADYIDRYGRLPLAKWYHRHAKFTLAQ